MAYSVSAGIIILNNGSILLGHTTGNSHWDIPKGMIEPDETPLQAAIRETKEETNVDIAASELTEIGLFNYRRDKKLHLFQCHNKMVDLNIFECHSFFFNHHNQLTPEIDDLQWFDINDAIENRVSKSMRKILKYVCNL